MMRAEDAHMRATAAGQWLATAMQCCPHLPSGGQAAAVRLQPAPREKTLQLAVCTTCNRDTEEPT